MPHLCRILPYLAAFCRTLPYLVAPLPHLCRTFAARHINKHESKLVDRVMWLYFFLAGVFAHMFVARVLLDNDRRDTPLHIACRKGNAKNVKYLLDNGADPNVFNFFRETPLLLACAADNSVIVKMLIDRGAECSTKKFEKDI